LLLAALPLLALGAVLAPLASPALALPLALSVPAPPASCAFFSAGLSSWSVGSSSRRRIASASDSSVGR
jgi:hypothetical protein